MLTGEYNFANDVTAFAEASYYAADTFRLQPPVILLNALWVPASNYWNPFGAVTLPNGQPNPNRIPGLTNVPAAGLPVNLTNYRFNDVGFQNVNVDNYQTRLVAGLRGQRWGYDWELGLLYGEVEAKDVSDNVNANNLQTSLALSTPDAYNPFNGGCVATPSFGDCTPSSLAAINAIRMDLVRKTRSSIAQADFRLGRSDLFSLPAGDVGLAVGLEARRETQRDQRDENLDGTIPFVDRVTGAVTELNVIAVSPNPDTYGSRNVSAAYLEFAVPVVAPGHADPARPPHQSPVGGPLRELQRLWQREQAQDRRRLGSHRGCACPCLLFARVPCTEPRTGECQRVCAAVDADGLHPPAKRTCGRNASRRSRPARAASPPRCGCQATPTSSPRKAPTVPSDSDSSPRSFPNRWVAGPSPSTAGESSSVTSSDCSVPRPAWCRITLIDRMARATRRSCVRR
jgi:hypothetical protein